MKRRIIGRFAGNSYWLAAQDAYIIIVTLIVGVFCARYLGPDGYGLLNYSMSFVFVFAAVCQLGLNSSVIHALVESPGDAGRVIGSALILRIIAAALSQFGLFAAVGLIKGADKLLIALTLLQGVSLFFDARFVLDSYFEARLESRFPAMANMAGVTVLCAMRAALVIARADIIWFAAATLAQSLVSFCVSWAFIKKRARVRLAFSLAHAKQLMALGGYFMLAGVASALYSHIDRLMIGTLLSGADLGLYSVASYAALVGSFAAGALITSARPLLLKLKREDEREFNDKFQALVFCVLALSAALGAGLFALGPLAIKLIYGAAYAPAGRILRVLCLSALFSSMNRARDIYLLARGLGRYSLLFALLGTGVNILLNILMLPRWGVTGAAAATMCTYVLASLIAPLAFPVTRRMTYLMILSPAQARAALIWLKRAGKDDNA